MSTLGDDAASAFLELVLGRLDHDDPLVVLLST
jgi:hypothetical protein